MSSHKIAVITGGTGDIGTAISKKLYASGYTVIPLCSHRTSKAKVNKWKRTLAKSGYIFYPEQVNVESNLSTKRTILRIIKKYGQIDVLVNNAGIIEDCIFHKMSRKSWDNVLKTNLSGAFNVLHHVVPLMRTANKGSIINISSVNAFIGCAGQTNYSASKAGLIGLTKSLAIELAHSNIHVNAVAPGYIESKMIKAVPKKLTEQLINKIPLGRFGSPKDVANLVNYLASDESAYITGQTFHVNGGLYLS